MPVLGHAFAGLATAMCTKPAARASFGAALWTPIVVGLAYLPDIANQLIVLAGGGNRPVLTHSLLFAILGSVVMAVPLAALARVSYRRALSVTLLSVLGHLALDLFQASNRVPLWPFSDRHYGLALAIIPDSPTREALLFGTLFGLFWVGWVLVLAKRRARRVDTAPLTPGAGLFLWTGRALSILILLFAAVTHYQRHVREQQLEQARRLLKQRNYESALSRLDLAERWPHPAKPGRIEYWRARVYVKLGEQARAEQLLHRSLRAAPYFYWNLAELALLYASSDDPPEVRRRRVEPCLIMLRERFPNHKWLPSLLERVERRLSRSVKRAAPKARSGSAGQM